ncbi:MAG: hypothetical protein DHS80DRAFT_31331 [Piptocephalis tieghemiana]|nr:MAG: hypothetical protein DHS80DRAFT_31331 [Piptocephalis tieghemiana]
MDTSSLQASRQSAAEKHSLPSSAYVNQGSSTTLEERQALSLQGLMPAGSDTLQVQLRRAFRQLRSKSQHLDKYVFLAWLRNTNIRLFYAMVLQELEEICPLIYTPTVGSACLNYSQIYPFLAPPGSADGLFISLNDVDHLPQLIANYRASMPGEPEICVITDGSRILGLGDLGVNGMGIPVGKLQLYVAAGGVNPKNTLPITLDLGTNTDRYLEDEMYLGLRQKRPSDDVFYPFVDRVLAALHDAFPNMLIQFEDFSSEHAFELLSRHRNQYLSFNDDIQGTGAVILSGFVNAINLIGRPIPDHRVLFFGAGSAGVGVAKQLLEHFCRAGGLSEEEARDRFWLVDSKGLITHDRGDTLAEHKKYFVRTDNNGQQYRTLDEVIEYVKPTALIGLSSQPGTFTPAILERMAQINERPIVFPLSNPAAQAECTFEEAMESTQNRVIFASGTAFPRFIIPETGEEKVPGQGNNMYIFPGLGLGSVLAKPKAVTDGMIYTSSLALASSLTKEELDREELYPRIQRIRQVSARVAAAVIRYSVEEGLAKDEEVIRAFSTFAQDHSNDPETRAHEETRWVEVRMWEPSYDSSSSHL